MTLISILAFSAAAMIFMLSFRMLEIRIGRDIISRNFRTAFDELIFDIYNLCSGWIKNKLKKAPLVALHALADFWYFALRKTIKAVNLIQSRIEHK